MCISLVQYVQLCEFNLFTFCLAWMASFGTFSSINRFYRNNLPIFFSLFASMLLLLFSSFFTTQNTTFTHFNALKAALINYDIQVCFHILCFSNRFLTVLDPIYLHKVFSFRISFISFVRSNTLFT